MSFGRCRQVRPFILNLYTRSSAVRGSCASAVAWSKDMYTFDFWIGNNYNGLFVIGDSSYKKSGDEVWVPGYRARQCTAYVNGTFNDPFEGNIVRAFAGRNDTLADRKWVFHSFALENYINDSLAEKSPTDERPQVSDEQYANAAARFPRLLTSFLERSQPYPTHILVLSKTIFSHVVGDTNLGIRPSGKYHSFTSPTGQQTLVMAINHPSKYFSWKTWHLVVTEFKNTKV